MLKDEFQDLALKNSSQRMLLEDFKMSTEVKEEWEVPADKQNS